jgi:hypothetical protein
MTIAPVKTRLIAVTTMLAISAGCASTSTLVTRHSAGPGEAPVRNLLLVGYSTEPDLRRDWELACAKSFGSTQLKITASHTLLPDLPERDVLLQLGSGRGFDAVLTAEISALQLLPLQMPPENVVSEERRASSDASPRTPGFELTLAGADKPIAEANEQDVELRLQRSNGELLWSGLIHTREANQTSAIARSQCDRLAKALHKAGLTP